jgi:hypothetical protein
MSVSENFQVAVVGFLTGRADVTFHEGGFRELGYAHFSKYFPSHY